MPFEKKLSKVVNAQMSQIQRNASNNTLFLEEDRQVS